jgi:hypothetical protein
MNGSTIIKRPSKLLLVTEGYRCFSELSSYYATASYLKKKTKNGDGHPVLVIPGFMATDLSTTILRKFLKEKGYTPYAWELGRNLGYEKYWFDVVDRFLAVHKETEQPISIIGWSLGGVFARHVARLHPDKVRQIITLGSPFAGIKKPNNASWLYRLIANEKVEDLEHEFLTNLPKPLPIPTTSIYSKADGIVSWKTCIEEELSETSQNIQVRGSHIGLGVNPTVLKLITNRLQFSKDNWEKFTPKSRLEKMMFYPSF